MSSPPIPPERSSIQPEPSGLEIAVVGCAGRFPGARSVDEFWCNIRGGVESIRFYTDEEMLAAGVDAAALRDPAYVKAAAVLDDIDLFDAAFFGMTPREAETMDPQHRLFLETAWNALEVAGYDPARAPGPVGVFGGVSVNTYLLNNLLKSRRVETGSLPVQFGNTGDYLTTRVSYKLDLKGPAFDVQTSCSSSLVAVHLAAQALIAGDCDMALAGGVSVNVPHGQGYRYQEQGIYSPDGHCRAFAADAQGTVGGNGVAVVALRRLADAIDDGDTIHAVILGSALNNDGSDKVGYAAPSVTGQAAVVRNAQTMAGVEPDTISYIETHGTGTTLGDPIEVAALTSAFRAGTDKTGFCSIGSVKTNIGHLDAAAGVTGLIKATLALEHAELPPSLNCTEPHPEIDFPSTPFRVNTELLPWTCDGPRRAGVSSFGIGGTNAHVILEQPPEPAPAAEAPRAEQLLVLSARSKTALDQMAANLAGHLRAHTEQSLADVAHTLAVGRAEFNHRLAVSGSNGEEIAAALEGKDRARVRTQTSEPGERPAVFLFPGQGSQYVQMGRELHATEPVFREHVDRACELLVPHLGLDLRTLLFPEPAREEEATEQLKQTAITQPALFVIEHALAQLWMSWGVAPEAMAGHSIGEFVCAALTGVFSLEDALTLVAARGRMMQELPPGDMLAVPLPAAEVEPMLGDPMFEGEVSLAAINEPSACVASGTAEAVAALEKRLSERDVACRTLRTSHAFHSAMMDPIVQPFTELVRSLTRSAPTIPFVSTMTGAWITDAEATDPEYWARHLRNPVRFADALTTLLEDPRRVYLEVGPGNTLTALGTRIARRAGRGKEGPKPVLTASMRRPNEELPDATCLLGALGAAWAARVSIDWSALQGGVARRRVPLPTYPFERQRFWIEPDADGGAGAPEAGKRADIADWFYLPSWARSTASLDLSPMPDAERVLVFADEDGLGDALAERLRQGGKTVAVVRADETEGAALDELPEPPELIVHLRSADGGHSGQDTDRGLFSLVRLAQAVTAKGWTAPLRIDVVTQGVQSVTGVEALRPDRASVLGACQSITQECANITCRSIDLAGGGTGRADLLLREIACRDAEPIVALRSGRRWVRRYEPVRVDAPAGDGAPTGNGTLGLLRENGHYLVTGGLGSIGLEVAACLGSAARARLVLTGRSAFPERDAWDGWLADHGEDDETSLRIRKLRQIEAAGAEVMIASADVTDGKSMAAVLAAAEERFGPLHGVVHAAGAEKLMGILADTDEATLEAQLLPKREGLVVLESLLGGRDVDFVLVQSSLSSCLGALGMVGYVAAHHWVDAFVSRHNAKHASRWTSVNWDNWLSWKEPEFEHDRGGEAYYMTPGEGAEALRRVLAMPSGTQVVVSTGSLDARIAQWVGGKSDDAAADGGETELHERPQLDSDYAAPTTPAEQALVAAWGETLGIGKIGVQDNFFELGGDSVLGLQIVAKVGQAGFGITPAQIFEHPTIAGLAAVATSRAATQQDQGEVRGDAPLLPIQHWFFEQGYPDPQHFNLPMLFEVPAGSDAGSLRAAIGDVAAHHDALRLRYRVGEDAVAQVHADDIGEITVDVVDLSSVPEGERDAAIRERATSLHTSLDLTNGPLMRAALFTTGPGSPGQVLWIIHHLLVDVVSWRVLIEDLQTALRQRAGGEAVTLPAKTTSFQAWARALAEHGRSDAALDEASYWRRLAGAPAATVPEDRHAGPDVFSASGTVTVALDEESTRALLQDVPAAYETRIDEVLLTALARAWASRTGADALLVDLEGHGRADLVEGLDLSRTVGWLTTLYPALLSLPAGGDPGDALKAVKEQVRAIPNHGLGFGLLRYVRADAETAAAMAAIPKPPINFLYLGQFDALGKTSSLRLLQDASGPPCSPDAPRGHALETVGYVMGGRLTVDWSYGTNRHDEATVAALADAFLSELKTLIEHCRAPTAGGRTPSDFPGAKVSQSDLDTLLSKFGRPGKGTGE